MSTKATILCGDDFHIYIDLNDERPRPVYMELDEIFSADVVHRNVVTERVTAEVKLSADLWERIARAVRESDK